jgi:hypothetical protein
MLDLSVRRTPQWPEDKTDRPAQQRQTKIAPSQRAGLPMYGVAFLLLCAACTSERSVDERSLEQQLAAAETAIAAAEAPNPSSVELDVIGLAEAREKLKRALEAARRNDKVTAKRLAEEAELDAREAGRQHYGGR